MLWYRLRWPREVTPEQITQVFRVLATVGGQPNVIEAVGSPASVEHRLALPEARAENVVSQLRAAIPGLAIEESAVRLPLAASHAVELRLTTRRRPLRTDDMANVSRVLLTALAQLHKGESLSLQWVLGAPVPALAVPNRLEALGRESWVGALLLAPFGPPPPVDVEVRNALRAKQGEPGWRAVGRLAVQAKSKGRERQLIRQVVGALRSVEAPGVRLWVRISSVKRVTTAAAGWRLPLRLNVAELATISGWPVGPVSDLPVSVIGSRLVAPSGAIRRAGRIIGRASFPGRERPVALTATDSLRHMHAIGPTGVGKSTLLLNLITQDMAAGRAVVVIEPKSDLIAAVLERIPSERIGDVVLLDPADVRPVGLNPLALHGRSPELVADQLLGLFHSMYAANWGPRTHDILGASLLTLARTPGMTLAALPLLLTDSGFRRRIVSRVADPIGLGPFWSGFAAWSEQQRAEAIAPVMNKLRPLLLRPEMRAIVGQTRVASICAASLPSARSCSLISARDCSDQRLRRCSAASLSHSSGKPSSDGLPLPRSVVMPSLSTSMSFRTYLHLPLDFADALAQARGLGVGFALAHQYLHQLGPPCARQCWLTHSHGSPSDLPARTPG